MFYAARLAGKENEEFNEMMESKSSWNILNAMKVRNRRYLFILFFSQKKILIPKKKKEWMINFLQRHGFIGVLLMSAYPNMAFDLCGIACGHFLMPFWEFFGTFLSHFFSVFFSFFFAFFRNFNLDLWIYFFSFLDFFFLLWKTTTKGATFIGKALIKVNGQAVFFITLFSPKRLEALISMMENLIPREYDPCYKFGGKPCHVMLDNLLKKVEQQFREQMVTYSFNFVGI